MGSQSLNASARAAGIQSNLRQHLIQRQNQPQKQQVLNKDVQFLKESLQGMRQQTDPYSQQYNSNLTSNMGQMKMSRPKSDLMDQEQSYADTIKTRRLSNRFVPVLPPSDHTRNIKRLQKKGINHLASQELPPINQREDTDGSYDLQMTPSIPKRHVQTIGTPLQKDMMTINNKYASQRNIPKVRSRNGMKQPPALQRPSGSQYMSQNNMLTEPNINDMYQDSYQQPSYYVNNHKVPVQKMNEKPQPYRNKFSYHDNGASGQIPDDTERIKFQERLMNFQDRQNQIQQSFEPYFNEQVSKDAKKNMQVQKDIEKRQYQVQKEYEIESGKKEVQNKVHTRHLEQQLAQRKNLKEQMRQMDIQKEKLYSNDVLKPDPKLNRYYNDRIRSQSQLKPN